MKKSLVIILFLTLIFTSFIGTINAITLTNDSLKQNIAKLNTANFSLIAKTLCNTFVIQT